MDGDIAIVVVDDDRIIREFIEHSLDQLSNNIEVFADCWSAWMHIKSNCADLVISDINMSGMNGLDLLQSIKRVFPHIRCIMISADYTQEEPARELGADVFLPKPFGAAALRGMVNDICTAIDKECRSSL